MSNKHESNDYGIQAFLGVIFLAAGAYEISVGQYGGGVLAILLGLGGLFVKPR